jgi:hypothetical protein
MSDDKTFTVGGTSVKNGKLTWRFANGTPESRAAVLIKDNHSDVKLQALPRPMTRDEAIKFLEANGIQAVDPTVRTTRESNTPKPPKQSTSGAPAKANKSHVNVLIYENSDPEVESLAKEIHKNNWMGFCEWERMTPGARNEYRDRARQELGK